MKNFSVKENCIGLDRLATWDEVHCAMAFWSEGGSELGCTSGGHGDVKSDAQAASACFPTRDTSSSSLN
jgi:hypothetical protein